VTIKAITLSISLWYVARVVLRRVRHWRVKRELRLVETLIDMKGAQQRFNGFEPSLREQSARRRAMAADARKEANQIDSGGEKDVRRKLRAAS